MKRIPVDGRAELLSLTAWQMLFGSVPLAVLAFVVPERPIEWSPTFLTTLVYNALGGMALATLLWLYILQRLPATISGLSSLIVPVLSPRLSTPASTLSSIVSSRFVIGA